MAFSDWKLASLDQIISLKTNFPYPSAANNKAEQSPNDGCLIRKVGNIEDLENFGITVNAT
jgi:hypothetical protein